MSWDAQAKIPLLALVGLSFTLVSSVLVAQSLQETPLGRNEAAQEEAQEEGYPPPLDLYEAKTLVFSATAAWSFQSGITCDLNGNIYLVYTEDPRFGSEPIYSDTPLPPVRKLSLDSETVVSYAVQSLTGYELVRRNEFAVDSRGTVYALLAAYERKPDWRRGKVVILNGASETEAPVDHPRPELPDYLIAKFKDDGTKDSFVKLQKAPGDNFEPRRFGVYADGNFLVTGVVYAEPGGFDKPFTGIFGRSGVLVRELKPSGEGCGEPTATTPEPRSQTQSERASGAPEAGQAGGQSLRRKYEECVMAIGDSQMTAAPDGNIYLLRASKPVRIYAISPLGEVVQEWTVKPPRGDVEPGQMSLAGQNGLLLVFGHLATREDPKLHLTLALLDLSTGKVTATYKLPEGKHGIPACMTLRDEFLVLGATEDRKLKVVKYVAR